MPETPPTLNLLAGFDDQLPAVVACSWPPWPEQHRQGCGQPIRKITTVRGKTQAVDATPTRGILYGEVATLHRANDALCVSANRADDLLTGPVALVGAVGPVLVDHHATCPAFQAKVAREQASRAATQGGRR
jgi:hypothetical protein